MEQARGIVGNNIVSVLMKERSIDLQEASDVIGQQFQTLMARFVETKARLPSFGNATLDDAVSKYVAAMEHWVIGNLEWSFKTNRYFGAEHMRVKETLVVVLRPRESDEEGGQ